MSCGSGTEAGGVEGLSLASGAPDEENGFPADAVGDRGFAAAKGMGVTTGPDQQSDGLPKVIGDAPLVGTDRTFLHGQFSRNDEKNNFKQHRQL